MSAQSEQQTARSEEADEQAQIEALVGEKPTRGALRRDWKLLPRLLPYLRPYRKFAVLSVLSTIVIAAAVLADVIDGLVSVEQAREAYGIVLTATGTKVDLEETACLRGSMRARI